MTDIQIANLALSHVGGRPIGGFFETSQQALSLNKWFAPARDECLASHAWNFAMKRARLMLTWNALTGVAFSNSGGLVRVTAADHGLTTGDRVHFKEVQGVPNANGVWYVTVVSSGAFELQGSLFNGAHVSGSGKWVKVPLFGWSYRFALPGDCLRVHGVNGLEGNEEDSLPYAVEAGFLLSDADVVELRYVCQHTVTAGWEATFINAFSYLLAAYVAQDVIGSAGKAMELRQLYERTLAPMAKGRDSRQGKGRVLDPDFDSRVVRARKGGF